MRDNYFIPGLRASADGIRMAEDVYLLTRVEVGREHREEGVAGQLLRLVTEDADREGVTLYLSVAPDGTGLNADALILFYSRRGFRAVPERPGMMRRAPTGTGNSVPPAVVSQAYPR